MVSLSAIFLNMDKMDIKYGLLTCRIIIDVLFLAVYGLIDLLMFNEYLMNFTSIKPGFH